MKSILWLLGSVALGVSPLVAGERAVLWPTVGMPYAQNHQVAAWKEAVEGEGFRPDDHLQPYLEWCDPPVAERANGVCVMLVSGGGYDCLGDAALVREWSERLTVLGCTCVELVYRTPRPKAAAFYRTAWADGQRAVRMVRADAAKRGFDPEKIGVMAVAAGSHLGLLLATSALSPAYEKVDARDETPCHLNWACLFSPAYVLTDGLGEPNARDGDAADITLDRCFAFDAKTCPIWLSHGGRDAASPIASTRIYRRLREQGVPAELHLYGEQPEGAFGFDRAVEFLRQRGAVGKLAPQESVYTRFDSDAARAEYMYERLWPAGREPNAQTNFCTAAIEWHIPRELKTKAIQIVWSGGGYFGNSPSSFEVMPVRRYLNAKGMAVVTVQYRSPRPEAPLAKHTVAWMDVQRAVRLVRAGAKRRGLDPDRIGVMGASAGGHLAMLGVTSSRHRAYRPIDSVDELSCAVQWGVAVYPAYLLTDGVDGDNAHGGNGDGDRLVPELAFDLASAPVCFLHGDADGISAMGSVKAWEQLWRMGLRGDLHTLVGRGHCFMTEASPGTASYTWLDRIWEFLSSRGYNR